MKKVAIVYWSGTGNTEKMANMLESVARDKFEVSLIPAAGFSADMVDNFDILALGCPSMGAEVLEEGEFEPMYESIKPKLSSKPVALFGSYGWGDGEWMRNWAEDIESAGARLVSEPIIANYEPTDDLINDLSSLVASF